MLPSISIIVPIYNAEKYIHRCLDSLLAQTYKNFELILINDGSIDNSGKICDEYSQRDNRIKVIHKNNGGVASARQCGIENAKGEYTIHVDPDDWVESNMLEELYNKAIKEKADVVICDFYVEEKDKTTYREEKISEEENTENFLQNILLHKLHGSLWNKLIKLACYKDFNISFVENLNTSEDYLICVKIFMNNVNIVYLNKAFYHYDQYSNSNSITHEYNIKTFRMHQQLLVELENVLNNRYESILFMQKAKIAKLCFEHNILTPEEFKETYKKEYKYLLPYIEGCKSKLLFFVAAIGYKDFTDKILRFERKIKRGIKNTLKI